MEEFFHNNVHLTEKPEDYLRPKESLHNSWVLQNKIIYDFVKNEEKKHNFQSIKGSLPKLYTNGLDTEQIWQQIELQNKELLAASDDLSHLDEGNLCFAVAHLSSLVKFEKVEDVKENEGHDDSSLLSENEGERIENEESGSSFHEGGSEDGYILAEEDESENDDMGEEIYDEDIAEGESEDENIAEEGESEDEVTHNKGDLDFEGESESELAHPNDTDSDDESDSTRREVKRGKQEPPNFRRTGIDTQFFGLRESEWVADNDIIGNGFDDDNSSGIDLMEEIPEDSEEDEAAMARYKDFFDTPKGEANKPMNIKGIDVKKRVEWNDNIERDDWEGEEDDVKEEEMTSKQEDETMQLFEGNKKEIKSSFERIREKEFYAIEALENENVSERPWFLKGEIQSEQRPENSALEEHLDYDIAVRHRPVITEDTTSLLEKIILGRIRSNAWDDVERKLKPNLDPFEYKKKLLLDQEKSKASLAEIYEQEYLKQQQQQKGEGVDEEPKEHVEIRGIMDDLFTKLDALSNYHYIPRHRNAEVKITSNLSAVTIEEATPTNVSDATLLAPQEILAPTKGERLGETERSTVDRNRDRRRKKSHQHQRAVVSEIRQKEKQKKAQKEGRLDVATSIQVVQKAVKAGHVKVMEKKEDKSLRSSKSFFKHLQENMTTQDKKSSLNDKDEKKRKHRGKKVTIGSKKLLL